MHVKELVFCTNIEETLAQIFGDRLEFFQVFLILFEYECCRRRFILGVCLGIDLSRQSESDCRYWQPALKRSNAT